MPDQSTLRAPGPGWRGSDPRHRAPSLFEVAVVMKSEVIRIGFPSDLPAEFGEMVNAEQRKDDLGLPADDLAFTYNRADGSPTIVVWVPRSRRRTLGAAGREIKTAWNARAKRSGIGPQGAA